jgi:hypothetical protein
VFFFEKKNQKTFALVPAHGRRKTRDEDGAMTKFIASFFQERSS